MKHLVAIFSFSLATVVTAQQSPFNHLEVKDSLGSSYSFLVSGHFHGSSSNVSGFPAASLLSNIQNINNQGSAFMVSTGDLFLDVKRDIPQYKVALFDQLKLPLFNVVGNHDIRGDFYQQHFGTTWMAFDRSSEKYIFLDTEADDGSIKNEQLKFFTEQLNAAKKSIVKNIFIFSHRPIWSEEDDRLKNVFQGNTRSASGTNFKKDIVPMLDLVKDKNVYWFSGSLGANAPASFFYYVDENKITFIQSAIRDLPRDGMLKVKVQNGQVQFETVSFTVQKMPLLEACGLKMWKTHPAENPFFWNLVPLYFKQMFMHRYFWYGVAYTIVGVLILYLFRKRIKRKRLV